MDRSLQPIWRTAVLLAFQPASSGATFAIDDVLRFRSLCGAWVLLQVVVLRKRDFLDLDNPLLAWMLDYDAVGAVLKSLPAFKGLKQDQMEHIFDRFDARQELYKGDTILSQGDLVSGWESGACSQKRPPGRRFQRRAACRGVV